MKDIVQRRKRIENALWGLFIGDALAMPVHWYYDPDNIKKDFNGGVKTFEAARHPHPESFMVGMGYHPDVDNALRLGRPYDILHAHTRFYQTSYNRLEIDRTERETEHGNPTAALRERYHYHHGLRAGENTLGAHLVRALIRSVIDASRYEPQAFIEAFIHHLATPGLNHDPYTEIYIRRWFEQYTRGMPLYACAELQRHSWSIGSHGGVIRPLVVCLVAASAYQGLGLAIEHQNLTHRSENNAAALGILVPMLHDMLQGRDGLEAAMTYSRQIRLPRVSGEELFAQYRDHRGPGNIPSEKMWELHTRLTDEPMDITSLLDTYHDEDLTRVRLATACYPEHGFPLILSLAVRHEFNLEAALLANANAGGDNVHRGMVLGMLLGTAAEDVPQSLQQGLVDYETLAAEIEAFAELAASAATAF